MQNCPLNSKLAVRRELVIDECGGAKRRRRLAHALKQMNSSIVLTKQSFRLCRDNERNLINPMLNTKNNVNFFQMTAVCALGYKQVNAN